MLDMLFRLLLLSCCCCCCCCCCGGVVDVEVMVDVEASVDDDVVDVDVGDVGEIGVAVVVDVGVVGGVVCLELRIMVPVCVSNTGSL